MTLEEAHQALRELPRETREMFMEYHKQNPRIWKEFQKYALQVAQSKKSFGAKAVMERIRWDAEIERKGEFKVSNNFTAYYARLFAAKYPEHKNLFFFKEVHGLKEAA